MIRTQHVKCDVCKSDRYKELFSMPDLRYRNFVQSYTIVACLECEHKFLNPCPVPEDIPKLYPDDYYKGRKDSDKLQEYSYLKRNKIISSLARECGKIMDIGCAGGGWLKSLKGNWEKIGIDFKDSPYKELGLNIQIGDFLSMNFLKSNYYDIITAWGVMEHIITPSDYFKKINSLLKKGAFFIFFIPNSRSLWFHAYKEDIPRHLHFFSPKIIKRYAYANGFTVRKMTASSALYSKASSGRLFFKRNLLRMLGATWPQIVGEENLNIKMKLLSKLGYMLDCTLIHPALEDCAGISGTLLVILEKK